MTTAPPRPAASGLWRLVGASAGSKILVLGVSGALSILTTRLMLSHYGVSAYAQFGLLAAMSALLPFADLGLSAAVVNSVSASSSPKTDPEVRGTLLSAMRLLLVSGSCIALIGIVLTLLGAWPTLLGEGLDPGSGNVAALLCLLVFAATLPFGLGQRVLTGLEKNHLQVLLQGLAAPFLLLAVGLAVLTDAGVGNYLATLSYLASSLVAVACFIVAARSLSPQVWAALRDVPKVRSVRGRRVLHLAWPMLIQLLAVPIAMQTDRLLLSHLAGERQLAQYNLGAQMFGLILQTISSAGIALWPFFARARARGAVVSPYPAALAFLAGGLGLGTVLALLLPWLTPLISDGRLTLDAPLVISFVAFIGVQAVKYPLGIYMTDERGLKFQVIPTILLVPVNLGLSWMLVEPIGAGGPIAGSAIAVFVCQILPMVWYVRRDLKRQPSTA